MARPIKRGLDYFPLDCDFFDDEKIMAISGEYGLIGEIMALRLLTVIYRNGYCVRWTTMMKMKMLHCIHGLDAETADAVVARLVEWEFFDLESYESHGVLTSRAIQRRYREAVRRRRLDVATLPHWLLTDEAPSKGSRVSVDKNPTKEKKEKEKKLNEMKRERDDTDASSPAGARMAAALASPAAPVASVDSGIGRARPITGNELQGTNHRAPVAASAPAVAASPVAATSLSRVDSVDDFAERAASPVAAAAVAASPVAASPSPSRSDFVEHFIATTSPESMAQALGEMGIDLETFRRMARAEVNRWMMTGKRHRDHADAVSHLLSAVGSRCRRERVGNAGGSATATEADLEAARRRARADEERRARRQAEEERRAACVTWQEYAASRGLDPSVSAASYLASRFASR